MQNKTKQIDRLIMSKVNIKQNTMNIKIIKRKLSQSYRNMIMIPTDSGDHQIIESNQLPE